MSASRILALAMGLLAASVALAVAPKHPVYNPPFCAYVLGSMAMTALIWYSVAAQFETEAAKGPPVHWYDNSELADSDLDFVVSFDDRTIFMVYPDHTESVLWDDLESVSVHPDDDFFGFIGPFFVRLNTPNGRLHIPASSVGLGKFMERLLTLPGIDPGIDRSSLEALMRVGLSRWPVSDREGVIAFMLHEQIADLFKGDESTAHVVWARPKGA
jgi:hypothetical protein